MKIDFILQNEYPNESWVVAGNPDDYNNFFWGIEECKNAGVMVSKECSMQKPSLEDLQCLWKEKYKLIYENKINIENRISEYPKIHELVVALWEKIIEGSDDYSIELQNKRLDIKNKYPINKTSHHSR